MESTEITFEVEFLGSIRDVPDAEWDKLFPGSNPFIRHSFLLALEDTGCAATASGWQPMHLILRVEDKICGAMPLYLKSHSYGEFVFDWGWAESYARHELDYYPKLLTAIPFTPSTGPRLGVADGFEMATVAGAAIAAVRALAEREGFSGWHLLFPQARLSAQLAEQPGLLMREAVQFHWRNRDYHDFDGFLAGLRSSRRKNLRKERRRVAAQGVTLKRMTGREINAKDWAHFYRCYVATYLKRSGHGGYLDESFFARLAEVLADHLLMITAFREEEPIASALFLFDNETLYGRYWGALQDVPCLHFETCFYQGIEFCIERGLQRFDPGTQGEHKLLRGFEPVKTTSFHWLANEQFQQAVAEFLTRERRATDQYGASAAQFLPFRKQVAPDK